MLPGKDGLSICREVRQFSTVPIMMLTAKVDEIGRLLGLEMGADDYVCKPFLSREVVARVKAILRRVQQQAVSTENKIEFRDIVLSPERFQCLIKSVELDLSPVEFRMLQALLVKPGQVFSRDRLMHLSYLDNRIVSHRTTDSHIKNLRKKIHSITADNEIIHSIYGVGYKIE